MFKGREDPVKLCEDFLRKEIEYNEEHKILKSENLVAHRLLKHHAQMASVYLHLCDKLPTVESVYTVLRALLSSQAFWSKDDLKEARKERARLISTNQMIADKAQELADLIREREELHNKSGFTSDTHYHVCDVIRDAADNIHNYHFKSYVKDKLENLAGCYDLKYWPSLAEFMDEVSRDAREGHTEASDPMTAAGTSSAKPSKADFIRAFWAFLSDCNNKRGGALPNGFVPSDAAMADIMNSVMELEADCVVTAIDIKNFRQRERKKSGASAT